MVINSELRFPVFKYLLNRPIRNDFIANFQTVGFLDVGTAWNGSDPWSEENALNNLVISKPPSIRVTVDRQKTPIVYGTGFGLRTRLFGYFVRADWAWGIDDGQIMPSVFYFSMSTDF
jgi:outer membrane protein assembly factor BamA